jgi:ABC-2 type transport system ATP-binding protein
MIEVKGISKKYPFTKSSTLNDLTLTINRFDSCALVGNNGCGKTTLIKILCNLIPFDSGEIIINGSQLNADYVSYKSDWGIVLSKPYFIEQFTVAEYLHFVGKFHGLEKQIIKTRLEDLLYLLSLGDNDDKKIKNLSSGNQMKVTLAAALIHNPAFLILDEPFVNLDIETVERVMAILKSFRGKKTYLVTSHNLEIITELCNKVLIMEKGKITNVLENQMFEKSDHLKRNIVEHLSKEQRDIKVADWLN